MDRVDKDTPNVVADCCQYEYQLLDKFCASRTAVSVPRSNPTQTPIIMYPP